MNYTESELRTLSQHLHEPEWLLQERLEAFQALQKILDDPHLKQKPKIPETLATPKIKIKKQKGVRIEQLHELLRGEQADFAKNLFLNRKAKDKKSGQLNFLNAFFTECNIFIAQDPESELEIESGGGPAMHFIILEKGTALSYTHRVAAEGFQSFEVHARENTQLSRLLIHGQENQFLDGERSDRRSLEPGDAGFLSNIFVLNEQARMEHVSLLRGGGNVEIKTLLDGPRAEAHDIALFSETDAHRLTLHSLLHQIAPDTRGDILVKGIARETAQAKLDGMIRIDKQARNSDSFLDQHVLLLNAGARADANPQLEIENNNVRSSHSASVGQIGEEKLFYLMARGISRAEARQLMVQGFLASAIAQIRNPYYQKQAQDMLL